MFRFWQLYIGMVNLLLRFVRSFREGNWSLHTNCVHGVLPFMFACQRQNYAWSLSYYYSEMCQLPANHPDVFNAFCNGEFAVRRSGKAFAALPVDQTIEQTLNKHSKSAGGIIGFSHRESVTHKWILLAHARAAGAGACLSMAGLIDGSEDTHKEQKPKWIQADQEAISRVVTLTRDWGDPFDPSLASLTAVGTGTVAPEDVQQSLLNSVSAGEAAYTVLVYLWRG